MTADRQSLRAALRERFPRNRGQLLPALHFLQREFGHLPDWAMEVVGWHLGVPASEVYGAATSYTELRIEEQRGHLVRVCTGLSCRVQGGEELLRVAGSETGSDGRVTLEETPCGFLCSMAPVVQVDHSWRGRVTPDDMQGLLRQVAGQ